MDSTETATQSTIVASLALMMITLAASTFIFHIGLRLLDIRTLFQRSLQHETIGKWAADASIYFNWTSVSYEMEAEAPAIFLGLKGGMKGFLDGKTICYVDGSPESCKETGSDEPDLNSQDDQQVASASLNSTKGEPMTWTYLLSVFQKMEKQSLDWERMTWRVKHETSRPEVKDMAVLAVGVQRYRRHFLAGVTMPVHLAVTSMTHLVQLAAVLGLHWKTFDGQVEYRADGNGYSLIGTHQNGIGIVFRFQEIGTSSFKETRVIPGPGIRELCFGIVPTFYRASDSVPDEVSDFPMSTPETLETLCLNSQEGVVGTLRAIGCSALSIRVHLEQERSPLLFPVVFEILGMLAQTFHLRNRCFTYLPNPTIYRWNRHEFSLRRLLSAFCAEISQEHNPQLKEVCAKASALNKELPAWQDQNLAPLHLNRLHDILDEVDAILKEYDKRIVLDVLRCHVDEILQAAARPAGDVTEDKTSFSDLEFLPRKSVEPELMSRYFHAIRRRVVNPTSADEEEASQGELPSRNTIWCTLVFRMICWLLLHNFHKNDVQMADNVLLRSSGWVYIA